VPDDITPGSLFVVTKEEAAKGILDAADEELWRGLHLPERLRAAAAGKIADQVSSLLDVSIAEVLGRAWNTLHEVREHADPATHPPGVDSTVTLAHYTVESEHTPRIELRTLDELIGALEFPVTLTLDLERGTVVIRDGSIRAVRPGLGKVTGKVSCAKVTLRQLGPETITLPGELRLAEPIRIPRLERAPG
jgi:hypothetical protein